MSDTYVLDGKKPVLMQDLIGWAHWFEKANRHVAKTYLPHCYVSTVFLGLDHGFGEGPPMLFETMVFGGPLDQEMHRCSTWEQAETMHKAMVERVNASK
jgi:hypothetical protein